MNNKISFITELLNSNKINASQKEKIFALATNEIKNIGKSDEVIFAEIADLKKKMEGIVKNQDKVTVKSNNYIPDLIHKPLETSRFLQSLSSDTNQLKYLIHDKTDGFNLDEQLAEWKNCLNNYKVNFSNNIKYSVIKRMKSIIGEENKDWFFKGKAEKFKFSDEIVKKWCSKNPSKHPILHFDTEISLFKESIKIYNGSLKKYVEEIIIESFGNNYLNLEIEYFNLEKAEFYTDVDALINGLKNIINSIAQRIQKSNKVKIIFEGKTNKDGRLRIIKIIHIGSTCEKKLDLMELFDSDGGGDFKDAQKRFIQVCDWTIISKNPDEHFNKLNIIYDLDKNIKQKEHISPSEVEGFTHILTFYS